MNEIEQTILSLIDDLVSAQVIRKETIITALGGDSSTNTASVHPLEDTQRIIAKLNCTTAISNQNFGLWCRHHNFKVRPKDTLDVCLQKGVFSYIQRANGRWYYVKNEDAKLADSSVIVWR